MLRREGLYRSHLTNWGGPLWQQGVKGTELDKPGRRPPVVRVLPTLQIVIVGARTHSGERPAEAGAIPRRRRCVPCSPERGGTGASHSSSCKIQEPRGAGPSSSSGRRERRGSPSRSAPRRRPGSGWKGRSVKRARTPRRVAGTPLGCSRQTRPGAGWIRQGLRDKPPRTRPGFPPGEGRSIVVARDNRGRRRRVPGSPDRQRGRERQE